MGKGKRSKFNEEITDKTKDMSTEGVESQGTPSAKRTHKKKKESDKRDTIKQLESLGIHPSNLSL